MSTCARCGHRPDVEGKDCNSDASAILRCRDMQIAAQAALLRSVTGKLEEAGEAIERVRDGLDGSDQNQWNLQQEADLALRELRSALEVLS